LLFFTKISIIEPFIVGIVKERMKIAVLVSGGVDSSVALKLLKDQGHDITAFYLKIWLEDELSYLGDCPWQEDLSYVTQVCELLDVPLEIISLQQEYKDEVVAYTIDQVSKGFTPNPDILCNKRIKFGLFLDKIDNSFDKIASGHYAQVREVEGRFELFQSPDIIKDQTYFLSHLTQQQLRKVLFPIGHLHKKEVRQLAERFALPNKDRKDSQGICFLGKFKFSDFIKHHLGVKKGFIMEAETENVLGEHNGFWFYTIGQRQGLRLAGGPWYVVDKDSDKNIVYISRYYYSSDKKRDVFRIGEFHTLSGEKSFPTHCSVKLRHGENIYKCRIDYDDKGATVYLEGNDQGIAEGQYAVFYQDQVCLGSGIMKQRG
jgi:tRNA (5-methylaminomethyl-2-thiouridylate)-methyltransferase